LQTTTPVETGVVMMLAIYSAGWEVDAPLFFALPPPPRVCADLWGMQISFVAARGKIWIICAGSGRLQRRLFSRVYGLHILLTRILQMMYCLRAAVC